MYAYVIIDSNVKQIDRPFSYRIPEGLPEQITVGTPVMVPFGKGNTLRRGYVIELLETVDFPEEKVKDISGVAERSMNLEDQLLELAIWMRNRYGGTLSQAISVVLPGKAKVEARKEHFFVWSAEGTVLQSELETARKKKHYARARMLEAFLENRIIPQSIFYDRLNVTMTQVKPFLEKGYVKVDTEDKSSVDEAIIRAAENYMKTHDEVRLNPEQQAAKNNILNDKRTVSLLYGITGSGKTEVYLALIEEMMRQGKETIVLIPEIALTYQTVMRFYDRFQSKVSVVHSRVSKGDKCERFQKAERGEISVMIGPRSALFTPFKNLGLIIIDECHENTYQSEQIPRYHAVETAIRRAEMSGGKVVLGSATPSVEHFAYACRGDYGLQILRHRGVKGSVLPAVTVVDMREELKDGNKSVFSELLKEKIRDRLQKKEQTMLFLNRRGYSGAVSCRFCGEPIRCPHCSVSLNYHKNGTLKCHICGYTIPMVKSCPKCGSNLIGTFGIGTQKVEELVQELFPGVRTLRMDADTTGGKDGHEKLLEQFMNGEADVLIGTQMIVKGHDFRNVTLVGILAADLSLNVPDFRSSERTFQLLCQAEGRAGRGEKPGDCVVQTYIPEHYAIQTAAHQDYAEFYRNEMLFRKQMQYPPHGYFMEMMISGPDEIRVHRVMELITAKIQYELRDRASFMGPTEASIHKVKDFYREVFYFKSRTLPELLEVKRVIEKISAEYIDNRQVYLTFEG